MSNKVDTIVNQLSSPEGLNKIKAEINKTIKFIENGPHVSSTTIGALPITTLLMTDNWQKDPHVMYNVVVQVVVECIGASIFAMNFTLNEMTSKSRERFHVLNAKICEEMMVHFIGREAFDVYKAAHPEEFK